MSYQLLKQAAKSSVMLMLLAVALSVFVSIQQEQMGYVMAMEDTTVKQDAPVTETVEEPSAAPEKTENTESRKDVEDTQQEAAEKRLAEQLGDRYLMIPKNEKGATGGAFLTEDYVYRTVDLMVKDVSVCNWKEDMVLRYSEGMMYTGAPDTENLDIYIDEYLYLDDEEPADEQGGADEIGYEESDEIVEEEGPTDIVQAVQITYDSATQTATASITLDHLYVPFLYEDADYYYIALKKPKDVYDKILVIDAGHGGKHPGTMSRDGVYLEKGFNLSIILHLKKLLDQRSDIKVYYTRLTDESVYLRPRVDLANEAEADFFISVHNNAYKNQYAYGTEVLYHEQQPDVGEGLGIGSKTLASLCLEEITNLLGTRDRGLRAGSGTYIIGHSEVPVALIEVGYLTNEEDLSMLQQDENLALTALGIYQAINRAYELKGMDTHEIR